MELLRVVYRNYRWPFAGVMVLSLASAALGVAIIAFINQRLVAASAENEALTALPGFIGLLVLLLAVSLAAQLSLTALGHWFVYDLRGRLIKRILDTDIERIEQIGSAHLLASISSDVHSVTVAFVRLPELVQGTILTLGSVMYLYTLSPPMLAVIAVWTGLTLAVGAWLVKRVYSHFHQVRETEDRLYKDFEAVIAGRKELALNRHRARRLYETKYESDAREYKHHIIRADTYHLSANNWANIMMLGAIGIGFFLANGLGWADTATAATFALTVLFLRTPMIQAVGAFPTLLAAQVAFEKLDALALAPHRASFDEHEAVPNHWHEIELRDVCYQYPAEGDRPGFRVGPINLRPYTYSDSRIKKDGQSGDSRAALIPRHAASAWADYSLGGMFEGLMLGGGLRYVGNSVDGVEGGSELPSYTLVDLMARYQLTRNWQAQLNVQNAADREYVASCDSTWCYYGDERTVLGSVSYLW